MADKCFMQVASRTDRRRWERLAILLVVLCGWSATASGASAQAPAGQLPTLTTALQAHSLSAAEAARGYPVHLQGVVTYFDPDYGTGIAATFIHDASGAIFVEQTSKLTRHLFVGALVDVQGVSAPGGFGPIVKYPQIRVLGRAPLPPHPPRVSLAILKTGDYDAQWVEVEGSVHQVIEYTHAVVLRLQMQDGPIAILMIKDPGVTYSNLVGALVRIDANAAPTMNADGQMIGIHLQAPNLSALQVLKPAPSDPFAGPYIPVNQLLQWGHFSTPMHRVHLRGTVTLYWPGSLLCIRDATRGICAQTNQSTPVDVGDQVDVSGFAETDNNAPVLTDAIYQSAGNNHPITPKPATAEEILHGGSGSELIQIDGLLIGYDVASSEVTLQLSSGDTIFPVLLPKNLAVTGVSAWKIGSRLRVTGICLVRIVDIQNNVRAGVAVNKSFMVLLRSPQDVVVLEGLSWWTPGHFLVLLALALIATLCVLGWVMVLRRRVEEQTILLRASEEPIPPYGAARCLDRTGNPAAAAGSVGCRSGSRQTPSDRSGPAHGGYRQVQADQRHVWTPGRRRGLARDRPTPLACRAQKRYRRPHGRRRVCRASFRPEQPANGRGDCRQHC